MSVDKLEPAGEITHSQQQQLRRDTDPAFRRKSTRNRLKEPPESKADKEEQQHRVDRLA